MIDPVPTSDPLPPPTTTSSRALQPRRAGSSTSSRSASRTASHAGSRAASARLSDTAPDTECNATRHDGGASLSELPIKRERSSSADERETPPSSSHLNEEPPVRKRRRLDTESIEELPNDNNSMASSSLSLGLPIARLELRHQDPEGGRIEQEISGPQVKPIDVDALPDGNNLVVESPPSPTSRSSMMLNLAQPSTSSARGTSESEPPGKAQPEPLSNYICPICFSPPTYATLTPCGHICCGECLFTAVKAAIERSQYHGPASQQAK